MTLGRFLGAFGVATLLTLAVAPAAQAGGMHRNEAEEKDSMQGRMMKRPMMKRSMMKRGMHHRMHHRMMHKSM